MKQRGNFLIWKKWRKHTRVSRGSTISLRAIDTFALRTSFLYRVNSADVQYVSPIFPVVVVVVATPRVLDHRERDHPSVYMYVCVCVRT